MIITFSHPGSDADWVTIDRETGEVTVHPGNRGGGNDFFEALQAVKHATTIKDQKLRTTIIKAFGDYLNNSESVPSEIRSPNGNIIAIF